MRILHLLSQTELTGSESYAYSLSLDQLNQGHEVFSISDSFHLPWTCTHSTLLISTGSFWIRLQNIQKLRKYLIEHKIDVVHCHSRAACRHLAWARMGLENVGMVSTIHGYQHSSFSKRLFNLYGDYVLAVCEKIEEQLVRDFRVPAESVKVLRNPLAATPSPSTKGASTRLTLSLLGRASGPKGRRLIELFVSEAQGWLNKAPELHIFVGLSGLSSDLKLKMQVSIKPADLVRVQISTGHVDLEPIYAKSFCVVASGRIAIEALLVGSEVIGLGEATLVGRVTAESFAKQIQNNFGDVGPETALDPQAVSHELSKIRRDPLSEKNHMVIKKLIQEQFDSQRICLEILETYRRARLYRKSPSLPILMYHRTPDQKIPSQHKTYVTKESFEQHLQFFSSNGFTTLHFRDLADFWLEKKPLSEFPKKPLILTFDDAYLDNITGAAPLLEKYKMKATLFVLADSTLLRNTWDPDEPGVDQRLMSHAQIKELPKAVYEIGSHGFSHVDLTTLADSAIVAELEKSKKILEDSFQRPILAVAYPFGSIDPRLPHLAQVTGHLFAVNTDRGELRWTNNLRSLFRINMFPDENIFSLWKKTSTWYRRRYFHRRGQ